MRITCPECTAGFSVPDKAIPEDGRKLRCSKCAHTWHQLPMAEGAEEEPENFGFMKVGSGEAPPDEPEEDVVEADGVEADGVEGDEEDTPEPVAAAAGTNLKAGVLATGSATKFRRAGMIALAALLAFIVIAPISLILARESVVSAWEPSALLYEKMGLPVSVAGEGLVIQNFGAWKRDEGGIQVLLIKGEIRNDTEEMRTIPTLRGTATDDTDYPLRHWLFRTEAQTLLPGEVKPFEAEFADPPLGTLAITITFSKQAIEGGLGY